MVEDYFRRTGNWSTNNQWYWWVAAESHQRLIAAQHEWSTLPAAELRSCKTSEEASTRRCRLGITRINGTLRFQMNDGTELPIFPNSVANSTLAYAHWGYYHYSSKA